VLKAIEIVHEKILDIIEGDIFNLFLVKDEYFE